jgi:hypothetical protein
MVLFARTALVTGTDNQGMGQANSADARQRGRRRGAALVSELQIPPRQRGFAELNG